MMIAQVKLIRMTIDIVSAVDMPLVPNFFFLFVRSFGEGEDEHPY